MYFGPFSCAICWKSQDSRTSAFGEVLIPLYSTLEEELPEKRRDLPGGLGKGDKKLCSRTLILLRRMARAILRRRLRSLLRRLKNHRKMNFRILRYQLSSIEGRYFICIMLAPTVLGHYRGLKLRLTFTLP